MHHFPRHRPTPSRAISPKPGEPQHGCQDQRRHDADRGGQGGADQRRVEGGHVERGLIHPHVSRLVVGGAGAQHNVEEDQVDPRETNKPASPAQRIRTFGCCVNAVSAG